MFVDLICERSFFVIQMYTVKNFHAFIEAEHTAKELRERATDINIDIWQQQQKLKLCEDPPMRCYIRYSISMLLLMRSFVRRKLLLKDITEQWMTDNEVWVDESIYTQISDDESFSW